MSQGNKTPTVVGIPNDEIQEAMKSFEQVKLRVSRRNDRGQLATVVQGAVVPIATLLEIDGWLLAQFGGGQYRVEPCNPNGTTPPYICPPFNIAIEGAPRPPMKGPAQPVGVNPQDPGGIMLPHQYNPYGGPYGGPPIPPGYAPPAYGPTVPQVGEIPGGAWAQGLHPSQANAYIQAGNQMYGPPGGAAAFGMVPMRPARDAMVNNPVYDNHMAFLRGDLAKAQAEAKSAQDKVVELQTRLKDETERLTREYERKLDDMRRDNERQMRDLEKAHEKDERDWERERQDMRERALRAELSANNTPKNGMVDLVPALIPAVTAYIAASSDRERNAASNQIEMLKLQMQGKGEDPTMALMKTVIPLAIPLIQQMMSNKSPEATAALLEAMQNNQMQSTGMLIQLIDQMTPDEKPVWAQVIMAALERMQDVGEKMMKSMNGGEPQRSLPPDQQQHHVQPTQTPQVQQAQSAQPRPQVADPIASDIDQLLMPQLPESFRTKEWRDIVVALAKKTKPEPFSKMLANHMAFLIENKLVPAELSDDQTRARFGGDATAAFASSPVDGLDGLVRPLVPVLNLDGEYVREIMWLTLVDLSERDLIDWAPPGENEDEEVEDEDGNGVEDETLEEAMGEAAVEHEYS